MARTLKLLIAAGVAAAVGLIAAESVSAQTDPIAHRRQIMRSFQGQLGPAMGMARGTAPYDAAKVQAALDVFAQGGSQLGALFPESSKTGETRALPVIWDNKADFSAKLATFNTDVAAAKAAAGDETAGKAALLKIGGDCGACHSTYRAPPPAQAGAPAGGGAPGAAPGAAAGRPPGA